MIGNQVSIKPAEGAAVYGKPKAGKPNSLDGADFNSILLSIMPWGKVYGAESAESSTAAAGGATDTTFSDATSADATSADATSADATSADATTEDTAFAGTTTATPTPADTVPAYNTITKNTAAGHTVLYNATLLNTTAKNSSADGIPENDAVKEKKTADIDNSVGDNSNLNLELLARDISIVTPSDTENVTTEEPPGKAALKKPILSNSSKNSDDPQAADKPAHTIQSAMTMAGYRFSNFNVATEGAADSAAHQTDRAPFKSNSLAAVQPFADKAPETPAGAGEKEVKSAEFKLPEPFAAINTHRDESGDYKIFTDIIGDNSISTESSTLKKAGRNAITEALSMDGDKKNEPSNNPNMLRFETHGIEYADIGTKEAEAVSQSNLYDSGIMEQISDSIKVEAENSDASMFKMKLKPEGLGEVTIKLSRSTDKIDVQISAELPSTKDLISKELDTLRVRLNSDVSEKQYQFASVTVEHEAFGTNASFSGGQYSRGGYNASYGKENNEYQTKTAPDDKPIKHIYEKVGNRLIDCIA